MGCCSGVGRNSVLLFFCISPAKVNVGPPSVSTSRQLAGVISRWKQVFARPTFTRTTFQGVQQTMCTEATPKLLSILTPP